MIDIDELKACKKTRTDFACTEACHIGDYLMRKLQHQNIAEVTSDKALAGTFNNNIQPHEMIKPKKRNFHNTHQQGMLGFNLYTVSEIIIVSISSLMYLLHLAGGLHLASRWFN